MKAYIKDIVSVLPSLKISNSQLEQEGCEWSDQQIISKIGVRFRNICDDNESSLILGLRAAESLLNRNLNLRKKIDYIFFSTLCHDHFMLNSAAFIQKKLNINDHCAAIDLKLGCSGYLTILSLAKALICSKSANNVLIITSDTYSKVISKNDFSCRSIFGDAATATIVSDTGIAEIGQCVSATDGEGSINHVERIGLFSDSIISTEPSRDKSFFYMDGSEIFSFVANTIPKFYQRLLNENGISNHSKNLTVFHQANKYMLNYLRKVIGIPSDLFYNNMEYTGNTSTSSIPIALQEIIKEDSNYDNIVCCSFGGGFCCSGTILKIAK